MLGKLFKSTPELMIGIDIGVNSVKVILLSKANNTRESTTRQSQFTLEAFSIDSMPADVMTDREITDIEEVGKIITKVRQRIPKHIKFAAAAVSGSTVISKMIYMDAAMTDEELENQIKLEADSLIPYPANEISLDFEKLSLNETDPSKANVLLTAARTESVEARVSALDIGGFKTKVIDVESFALSRAAQLCYDQLPLDAQQQHVAIIDIGATMMLMSILHDGETIFTRDQAFGGNALNQALMASYGLTMEEAETAKRQGTIPDSDPQHVISQFEQALIQQIRRSIQLFKTSTAKDGVDYLIISGGSALLPNIEQKIQEATQTPTFLAKPCEHMQSPKKKASTDNLQLNIQQLQPQFMIALGLALRSFSSWHI